MSIDINTHCKVVKIRDKRASLTTKLAFNYCAIDITDDQKVLKIAEE